jgi:hypothetical protein
MRELPNSFMVRARDSQPPDSSHLYSQFRPRMTLKWQTAQRQQRVTRQSTIAAKCIIKKVQRHGVYSVVLWRCDFLLAVVGIIMVACVNPLAALAQMKC